MSMQRRRFIQALAGTTAGATGAAAWPDSIRRALAIPAARRTGSLQDVQHVVILTQENRSFDHYLGSLRGVRGFDDPRPAPLPGGGTVWQQPASGSGTVLPFHLDTRTTSAQCLGDIDHSWKGSNRQWKDWDAWVATKGKMSLGHFKRADLPYYHALADAFTVCDAYHCSVFGPTNPNRLFLVSGTSGLSVGKDGAQAVSNTDDGNYTADMANDDPDYRGLRWTTYAERLQARGVSWRVYQEYDNYGDNLLASFASFRRLQRRSPLYRQGRDWVPGSDAGNAGASRGEHLVAELARDVREGTLPQVSWIVGPFITTEHPDAPPAYGESFVSRVLDALTAEPAVWAGTVLILNFDENGGFFDHLPSPLPALDAAQGLSTVSTAGEDYHGEAMGLGVRTPMLVISPWSRGGWVNSQVFDHSSVLRFLAARFGVDEPNISPWRRAVCGDLTSALDFSSADVSKPALPDTSRFMQRADRACRLDRPRPPNEPQMPRQEPGQRPARALPYALQVTGRIDVEAGRYWLEFQNQGSAGAVWQVYAANRSDGPWHYTVEAGRTLADYWSAMAYSNGEYDLAAYGPNGHLRHFRGRLQKATAAGAAQPELQVEVVGDELRLQLHNHGSGACRLTLRANFYSDAPPSTHELAAGARLSLAWPLAASQHWYDLSLTSSHDRRYLRRIAGHVETGRASVSDPALGRA